MPKIDWEAEDAGVTSVTSSTVAAPRQPAWKRKPLEIRPDMPLGQQAARKVHNTTIAHDDAMFALEHELAFKHFDAVGREDQAGAAEALAVRIRFGFAVD